MKHWLTTFPAALAAYITAVVLCIMYVPVGAMAVGTTFLGLIGQSGFVLLFATRDWQDNRFMRALMLKSATLWLLFLIGAIRVSVTGRPSINSGDVDWLTTLVTAGNVLIIAAIWYQALSLFLEIRKGWLDEAGQYDHPAQDRA